jgi:hypothetical protein
MSIETQSIIEFVSGYSSVFEPYSPVPLLVKGADASVQYWITYPATLDDGGFFERGNTQPSSQSGSVASGSNFAPKDPFVCGGAKGSYTIKAFMGLTGESAEFIVAVALPAAAAVTNATKPVPPLTENEESEEKVSVRVTSKKGTAITYGSIRFSIYDSKNTYTEMADDEGNIGPGTSVLAELNKDGAAVATVKLLAGLPGAFFIRAEWVDASAATPLFVDLPFKIAAA